MALSLVVVLSCLNLSFTKPLSQEAPSFRNQALNQLLREQESQPKESVSQETHATSAVDWFPGMPVAHNRTTRDVGHPCVSRIVRVKDWCRNEFVNHVQCLNRHVSCYQAIYNHHYPKCQTVYGYLKAKFVSKCSMLPIGCRCAA